MSAASTVKAVTSSNLRDALDEAVKVAESKKDKWDRCPDCKKNAALLSVVFRGIRVARICRFCPHTSFHTSK